MASAQQFPSRTTLPADVVRPATAAPLSAADAVAVHETVTRMYLAEDARDLEALRQLVSEQLVHEHSVYGRLEGVEAFVGWVRDNPAAFDRFRHHSLNIVTRQVAKNKAEAVSYILVLQVHPGNDDDASRLPKIIGHGVVRDALVKDDGRWRIAHRIYDQMAVSAALVPDTAARIGFAAEVSSPSA